MKTDPKYPYDLDGCQVWTMDSIDKAVNTIQEWTPDPVLPDRVLRIARAYIEADDFERGAFGTKMYRTRVFLADMLFSELETVCRPLGITPRSVIATLRD